MLKLNDECQDLINDLRNEHKYPCLTNDEEMLFRMEESCWICSKYFVNITDKVRDHCHYTGKYRGAACKNCNLNFHHLIKKGKKYDLPHHELPVIFHNLRGYDGHFIIQEASHYTKNIKAIRQSFEKYMTFSFMNLKFIDSMQFMNSSLEKLADNLIIREDKPSDFIGPINNDYSKFIHMKQCFKKKTSLLSKKGLYPYEYVQKDDDFNLKTLPSRSSFYSELNDKTPSVIEYEQAVNVYDT